MRRTFEQRIERACRDKEIPGAVLIASDKDGNFRYEKAFGNRSLKDPSQQDPLTVDATMWLASCSKLPTSVSAMQCVERGLIGIDDDVTDVLTELKGLKILVKFDEDDEAPTLVENTKPITLRLVSYWYRSTIKVDEVCRHLLTHSSGLTYDVFSPLMMRYRIAVDKYTPNIKIRDPIPISMSYPLLFEPGTSWEYGVGHDWAGKLVERLTGMDLETYLSKNIWGPLGTTGSITFFPKSHPTTFQKLMDMSVRSGGLSPMGAPLNPQAPAEYQEDPVVNQEPPDCFGSMGLFGNLTDFQALLHSICADDGKILRSETINLMFQDHLAPNARAVLEQAENLRESQTTSGTESTPVHVTHGLGGMIYLKDVEGSRRTGTMAWGGYPNLIWFVDRTTGMSGVAGTQICPPIDPKCRELFKAWEQELYKKAGRS